jgi:hypothetical protein
MATKLDIQLIEAEMQILIDVYHLMKALEANVHHKIRLCCFLSLCILLA